MTTTLGPCTTRRHGVPVPARPDRLLPRTGLLDRIRSDPAPILVVLAPAGSGKTTLLTEWLETDARPAAWLTIERIHADPVALVAALARALAAVHPDGPLAKGPRRVVGADALRSLARLTRALDEEPEPTLLVIDDVHRLTDRRAIDLVVELADRFPATSRLALASRHDPGLPISRWQLAGRVQLVERRDLDLDAVECGRLLERLGVPDAARVASTVHRRTEGWTAGVHLMGLAHRREPDRSPVTGHDGSVALAEAYVRSELLDELDGATRTTLARASILEVVTPPLAEALSDEPGGARRLTEVAERGLLVTPLDASSEAYRFHSLLRDTLAQELVREPADELDAHLRASTWYEAAGQPDDAIEHALAAGDMDLAARLVLEVGQGKYRTGELASLARWIGAFDEPGLRAHPDLAALAAFMLALEGEASQATHLATGLASRSGMGPVSDAQGPGVSLVRAMLCMDGPEAMLEDAVRSLDEHHDDWQWRTSAVFAAGMAALMLGRADEALARFQELERVRGAAEAMVRLSARAERAMAEMTHRRWQAAQAILEIDRQAVLADPESGRIAALGWLVADARLAVHRGDPSAALERLRRIQVGRVRLSWALPWHAVRTLTELARVQLLVGDHQGARVTVSQARDTTAARPRLGILIDELEAVSQHALAAPRGEDGWSTLTRAELRLLPLLQTYLTVKEIAERLGVSPNTAKTQALSIYGKLAASTRSEAVEAAVARGLLEDVLGDRP